jgi:sugar-specific transcriptional regulator TrmB
MATAESPHIDSLRELGLTGLEAEAYAWLLTSSPATGYGVAKGLGKPTANTYKALDSLREKGAVVTDDDETRAYRAVPPAELLAALERRFLDSRRRAAEALGRLGTPETDERVYRLSTPEQVIQRARQMLLRAREVAVLDLFPLPAERLRSDLEAAADRGIRVVVKCYAPVEIPGARVIQDPASSQVSERWPAQWANAVVDGAESLLALLSRDGTEVHQAIWSGSPFISWVYYSALIAELFYSDVSRGLENGLSMDELENAFALHKTLRRVDAPGYRELLRRLHGQAENVRD